jgi:hypothetical protein
VALFFCDKRKRRENAMSKENKYATNAGGIIKAPNAVGKEQPRATVVKGGDLRTGKKSK